MEKKEMPCNRCRFAHLFSAGSTEIAAKRNISLLSTRQRGEKLVYLLEEQSAEEWKRRTWVNLEKYQKEHIRNIEQRKQELVDIHKYIVQNRIDLYRSHEVHWIVDHTLGGKTTNISTLAGKGVWSVLGYRLPNDKKYCRVVVAEKKGGIPKTIWANNGLRKVLLATTDSVEKEVDTYKRETYWFPREYYKRFFPFPLEHCSTYTTQDSDWQNNEEGIRIGLDIRVQPQKKFVPAGQEKEIAWYPIDIEQAPIPAELPSLRQLALEKEHEEKQTETLETLYKTTTPNQKDWKKAIDLAPGQYLCRRYATTVFRGNTKTILFLLPIDENGEPTTDAEIPTHGHFLEKEVERIGALQKVLQPIACKVGIEKTTPQKKKIDCSTLLYRLQRRVPHFKWVWGLWFFYPTNFCGGRCGWRSHFWCRCCRCRSLTRQRYVVTQCIQPHSKTSGSTIHKCLSKPCVLLHTLSYLLQCFFLCTLWVQGI